MAWVAADRMARSVRTQGLPGPVLRWEQLRDQIHHDVVTHAFDAGRNTFTQAYGSTALDASLLLIPRLGFLPGTDRRVMGTIAAVRRELSEGDFIRRYQTSETDDGVKGSEGLFIPCSFWLVDALYAAGQRREAVDLFERLLLLRNDVGLLSEEWDPPPGASWAIPPRRSATSPWSSMPSSCTWGTWPAATTPCRRDHEPRRGDRPRHPDRVRP